MRTQNSAWARFSEEKIKFLADVSTHCILNRRENLCRKDECNNCGNNYFREVEECTQEEFFAIMNRVRENLNNEQKLSAHLSGEEETPYECKKRIIEALQILLIILFFSTIGDLFSSDIFFFFKIVGLMPICSVFGVLMGTLSLISD